MSNSAFIFSNNFKRGDEGFVLACEFRCRLVYVDEENSLQVCFKEA